MEPTTGGGVVMRVKHRALGLAAGVAIIVIPLTSLHAGILPCVSQPFCWPFPLARTCGLIA